MNIRERASSDKELTDSQMLVCAYSCCCSAEFYNKIILLGGKNFD